MYKQHTRMSGLQCKMTLVANLLIVIVISIFQFFPLMIGTVADALNGLQNIYLKLSVVFVFSFILLSSVIINSERYRTAAVFASAALIAVGLHIFVYFNADLPILAVGAPALVFFLLISGPSLSLPAGIAYIAAIYVHLHFFTNDTFDLSRADGTLFSLLILVWPLSTLTRVRRINDKIRLTIVRQVLLSTSITLPVLSFLSTTWQLDILGISVVCLAVYILLRQKRSISLSTRYILLAVPLSLYIANVHYVSGLTLYTVFPYLIILIVVAPRSAIIALTAVYIIVPSIALGLDDGYVLRTITSTVGFLAISLIWLDAAGNWRTKHSQVPVDERRKLAFFAGAVGVTLSVVMLAPMNLGWVSYTSHSALIQTLILEVLTLGFVSWITFELSINRACAIYSRDEANRNQQRQMHRESALFAVISHEIRTAAAILQMKTDSSRNHVDSDEIHNDIKGLVAAIDEMKKLSNENLSTPALVESNPVLDCNNALIRMENLLAAHGCKLKTYLPENHGARFRIEEGLVDRITDDLLRNSAIYSAATSAEFTLELEPPIGLDENTVLRIIVEGNGTDLAKSKRPISVGSGMTNDHISSPGLIKLFPLTHALNRCDGDLIISTSDMGGTRFQVAFRAEYIADVYETNDFQKKLMPLSGVKVLVAEDEPMLRALTTKLLTKLGAEVSCFEDGEKALSCWHANSSFDLVLTDIMMPNMDGFMLTRKLRAAGVTKPIVGVTAAVVGAEQNRLLDAGADLCLSKPLTSEKIQEIFSILRTEGRFT